MRRQNLARDAIRAVPIEAFIAKRDIILVATFLNEVTSFFNIHLYSGARPSLSLHKLASTSCQEGGREHQKWKGRTQVIDNLLLLQTFVNPVILAQLTQGVFNVFQRHGFIVPSRKFDLEGIINFVLDINENICEI